MLAYVLTVDLGTSGPKAAVVSSDGHVVGSGQHRVTSTFPEPGAAEQDPDEIWQATVTSCREAIAAAAAADVPASEIRAVIVSSQYSSIVPVDAEGNHLHPMLLWMDHRGAPKRIKDLPGFPKGADSPTTQVRWIRVHGLAPIDGGIALTHMRWIKYARPEIYAHTAAFLEPMDYLTMRLCGRATANQCTAFMSLTIDNRTLGTTTYEPSLVEESLIDADKLPPLVSVGENLGPVLPAVAAELGLAASTAVLSGCNDTQAGAIAAGAFRGDHAGISLGTTGVIVTHRSRRKTDPFTSIFTVPGALGGCHLVSAENGVAGVGMDHFLRTIVYGDDPFRTNESTVDAYEAFNEAAALSPPGARGVMYLPWLRGSIAPKADGRMRGGFLNVGLDTDRNDMARALLEGVALNYRWLYGNVEKFVKRSFSHVVFYGGGAKSDLWSQIMADVLGVVVHQLDEPRHANSLGTGLLAFERLGIITLDDVLRIPKVRAVFEPNPANRQLYDERSELFEQAFKQTRPLFRSLNRRG
jgi:xylulokinase